jgi:hypothetical protein
VWIGRRIPGHGEIAPNVVSVPEATWWRWAEAKVISAPEVLVLDDLAWWTHVAPSFVGHENICKYQRIVLTL